MNLKTESETDECFVELSKEHLDKLEKYCNKTGISMEEASCQAIKEYLDKQAPVGA